MLGPLLVGTFHSDQKLRSILLGVLTSVDLQTIVNLTRAANLIDLILHAFNKIFSVIKVH